MRRQLRLLWLIRPGDEAEPIPSDELGLSAISQIESGPYLWQSGDMDPGAILHALRLHESELKAAGILHLRLFGSSARGEGNAQSDVDLMAEIDRTRHFTLLSLVRIEDRLSGLLGVKVDLSLADCLKAPVRERAIHEAVLAF